MNSAGTSSIPSPNIPKKNGRITVRQKLLPGTSTRMAKSTASATNNIDFTRGLSPAGAEAVRFGADFEDFPRADVFFLVVCFFADNPFTFLYFTSRFSSRVLNV